MSSSTSGHDACTASRSLVRIGFAKSPALAMYASTRGSFFPIHASSTVLVSRVPVRYPVVVDPVAPDDEQPQRLGRPGDGGRGRRRRPERGRSVDDQAETRPASRGRSSRCDRAPTSRAGRAPARAPKRTSSTASVAGIEYHSPSPSRAGPFSVSGMSGRCVTTSSTQWLTTSSTRVSAADDARAPDQRVDAADGDTPHAQRGQAVRVRIADEIERRHRGHARRARRPARCRAGRASATTGRRTGRRETACRATRRAPPSSRRTRDRNAR